MDSIYHLRLGCQKFTKLQQLWRSSPRPKWVNLDRNRPKVNDGSGARCSPKTDRSHPEFAPMRLRRSKTCAAILLTADRKSTCHLIIRD
jgi:hypothetical protein